MSTEPKTLQAVATLHKGSLFHGAMPGQQLTPLAEAQGEIDALRAKLRDLALQSISSDAQQQEAVRVLTEALVKISAQCARRSAEWSDDMTLADFGGNADDFARAKEEATCAGIGDIARAALAATGEKGA